jgi:hypothetical protein
MLDKETSYCDSTLGVLLKICVSPDMMPSSIVKAIQRFGDIYRLRIQVRSVSFVVNQYETGGKQIFRGTILCNIPEDRTLGTEMRGRNPSILLGFTCRIK